MTANISSFSASSSVHLSSILRMSFWPNCAPRPSWGSDSTLWRPLSVGVWHMWQWPSTTAAQSIWRRTQDHPGPGLCSDSFWPWQPSVGLIEIGLCDMGGWSLYFKCWALFSDVFKMPSCQLGWHLYLAVLGSICPVFKQIPSPYTGEFNNWAFNLSKVE